MKKRLINIALFVSGSILLNFIGATITTLQYWAMLAIMLGIQINNDRD